MMGWLRRLMSPPTCAGCGRELVTWTDSKVEQGHEVEMRWRACPVYRDTRAGIGPFFDPELSYLQARDRHEGYWTSGRRTPLRRP